MNMLVTISKYLRDPSALIPALVRRGYVRWIPDEQVYRIIFRQRTGIKLDLKTPKTFSEKIQWLKLYDRNPQYSIYADKYSVRNYVEGKIGREYLIPLLGVYQNVSEIPWENLPDRFVLKCTHGQGANIICEEKKQFDIKVASEMLERWMKTNYYWKTRERQYYSIIPRIVCEEYLSDETDNRLYDYKVFCFNGKARFIQVHYGKPSNHKINTYTPEWEFIEVYAGRPTDHSFKIEKPFGLKELIRISEKLSQDIPHLRVDFYNFYKQWYFGEMTFYHGGGYHKILPDEMNIIWGGYLELPNGGHGE